MSDGQDDIQRLLRRTGIVIRRSGRYWPIYLLAVAGAIAAALLAPRFIPPVYVSGAVLVYQELIATSKLLGQGDAVVETPRQRGARLKEVLLARSNVEQIIDELSLYPDVVASDGKSEAVNQFLLDAEARVGDDTFTLQYRYHDPDLAEKVTSRMAELLVAQSVGYRLEQARSTVDFLAAQRQSTKVELLGREEALAEFFAAHPEFALDMKASGDGAGTAGASFRARNRKDLATEAASQPYIGALQRQRLRLAARISSIDNPQAPAALAAPIPPSLDPEIRRVLEQARREVERAQTELGDARSRFTEVHPDVNRARSELNAAQASLAAAELVAAESEAATPTAAPLSAPPAKAADRAQLQARLGRIDVDLRRSSSRGAATAGPDGAEENQVVELETRWASLQRELRDVQERHGQIERRFFEASIIDRVEAAGGAAQMMIVDPAYRPERPTTRGARRVGAVAAALVLLVLGGLALLLASIDDRLYDKDDLVELELDGFGHVVPSERRA